MEISLATNWDIELLDGLKEIPSVKQVFGKMPVDMVGGGRCGQILPTVDEEGVRNYAKEAHIRGIKLSYVLNANCVSKLENDPIMRQKFVDFIGWLSDAGVDGVAMTSPLLIKITKKKYPNLKVASSVFAQIVSVEMAKYYEESGCDTIVLPYFLNRNFELLESFRKNIKCDLQLFTQNACLYFCSNAATHGCFMAHASQHQGENKMQLEYYAVNCGRIKMESPEEFIKSRWIRPEDLKIYEDMGYTNFKITDRSRNTPWLLNTAKAYHERRYDGNLSDILSIEFPDYRAKKYHPSIFKNVRAKYLKSGGNLDESFKKWLILANKGAGRPYIDNNALDGFLEHFMKIDCTKTSCSKCKYCMEIANKAISFNQAARREFIDDAKELIDIFYADFQVDANDSGNCRCSSAESACG